jgi:hypothetical protein
VRPTGETVYVPNRRNLKSNSTNTSHYHRETVSIRFFTNETPSKEIGGGGKGGLRKITQEPIEKRTAINALAQTQTNSTEQSPSWEANSHSASHKFPSGFPITILCALLISRMSETQISHLKTCSKRKVSTINKSSFHNLTKPFFHLGRTSGPFREVSAINPTSWFVHLSSISCT